VRYFKSLIFDVGLALIVAGVSVAYLSLPKTQSLPEARGEVIRFQPTLRETDMRLPFGLAIGGLVIVGLGIRDAKRSH